MTTRDGLKEYVRFMRKKAGRPKPIYRIMMFEHKNKERCSGCGEPSGFPDTGATYDAGFCYDLDTAIRIMETNETDLRERMYDAGFILCHFPGIGESAGTAQRMYFAWDEGKQGFFQQEEPGIFRHIAY